MKLVNGLVMETGTDWKCKVCDHCYPVIGDEEWPLHCEKIMTMQPWYRLVPAANERSVS